MWGIVGFKSPNFSDAIFQRQVVGHSGQPLALWSRLATHWDVVESGAIGSQEKPMKVVVDPLFRLISWGSTLIGIHIDLY